ncbi:hypothetical protein KM043_004290 [Ampulex compressa]|nr:hypothetical protein KM043_004290 [Ampulex compressa]
MSALLLLCAYIASSLPAVPSAPTPKERYNFFNTDLQQVVNEEVDGNIIISPVSAKVALTSLIEATGGRTRQELLSTLRLPPDERTVRNVVERNLIPLKSVKNGTEIDVATRLWVQEQLSISEDYVKSLQTYYGTDVERVDFKNAHNAANAINSWVRRETRDKIESLVDPGSISADTPLLLTSTLYFKGRWLYAFEKSATQLRCFYVPNVGCQDTYLMENTARYRYAYIPFLAAEAIELPYSDRKTSMLILMPAHPEHDQDLRILSRDLSYMSMSFLLGNLQETEVLLSIPKFSIESKLDLISALTRMGIRDLFDSNANITAVASQAPLRVAGVVQNAKIEVDEDGTVAAAATGVMIVPLMTPTIQNFTANRPFLFAIVDLETNSTLFTGRFMRPQENNTGST